MQHHNWIWQLFLVCIGAILLWYTGLAAYKIYQYTRLNSQTVGKSLQWTVEKKSDDLYLLTAHYDFETPMGKEYEGTTVMSYPSYWNHWAAKQAIQENTLKKWTVWFDQTHPEFASLEKFFPIKETISALVLWGILLYFLWLDWYVAKFRKMG